MPEKTKCLIGKRFETSYFFERKVLKRNLQDDRYHQSSLYCPDPQYYLIKSTAKSTNKEHENKKIQIAQPQYIRMGLYQDFFIKDKKLHFYHSYALYLLNRAQNLKLHK